MSPSWYCSSSTCFHFICIVGSFSPKTKLKLTSLTPKKAALFFFIFLSSLNQFFATERPEQNSQQKKVMLFLLFKTELLGFVPVNSGSAVVWNSRSWFWGGICAYFVVTFYYLQAAQKSYEDLFFFLPLEEKLLWARICWAVCAHPCASSQGLPALKREGLTLGASLVLKS